MLKGKVFTKQWLYPCFLFTCSVSLPTQPLHTACSSAQDSHVHLHPDGSTTSAVRLWIQPHPLHEDDLSSAAHVLDTNQVSVTSSELFYNRNDNPLSL